jgi:hypothetical protein
MFYGDAMELMNHLLQIQSSLNENSDSRKYILKSWVRVALVVYEAAFECVYSCIFYDYRRTLGSEFVPYLPMVMEQLLAAIGQDLSAGTGWSLINPMSF